MLFPKDRGTKVVMLLVICLKNLRDHEFLFGPAFLPIQGVLVVLFCFILFCGVFLQFSVRTELLFLSKLARFQDCKWVFSPSKLSLTSTPFLPILVSLQLLFFHFYFFLFLVHLLFHFQFFFFQ